MADENTEQQTAPAAIDLAAIKAEARKQGYSDACEIVQLCALAGMPARAAALLARQATPAEARQQLLEARAAEIAGEIHSHVMPDTGTQPKSSVENNPVVKAVERLIARGGR